MVIIADDARFQEAPFEEAKLILVAHAEMAVVIFEMVAEEIAAREKCLRLIRLSI